MPFGGSLLFFSDVGRINDKYPNPFKKILCLVFLHPFSSGQALVSVYQTNLSSTL